MKMTVCGIINALTILRTTLLILDVVPGFNGIAALPSMSRTKRMIGTADVSEHRNIVLLRRDICGPIPRKRKAYGSETGLFEFPWMALILQENKDGTWRRNCGGSVINERYVLTAAHCVMEHGADAVRLGEHDLRTDIDCESYEDGDFFQRVCASPPQDILVEKVILHPEYSGRPDLFNDIALLRLSDPADFTRDNVRPVCLPIGLLQQNENLQWRMLDVAGWGKTEKGKVSDVLLKAKIPVLDLDECKYDGPLSPETQLCAGKFMSHSDACSGDSGGPLTHAGMVLGNLRIMQYGIVSFGDGKCGGSPVPSIYTRVGHYMEWILDNIKA